MNGEILCFACRKQLFRVRRIERPFSLFLKNGDVARFGDFFVRRLWKYFFGRMIFITPARRFAHLAAFFGR